MIDASKSNGAATRGPDISITSPDDDAGAEPIARGHHHAAAEDEDDADEEEEEPRLKYNKLTGSLSSLYRNGDDTSGFLVAGDKMIIGTHNGNIHALALPSLQPLRTYHAHSASVTSLSISPIPPAAFSGPSLSSLVKAPTEPSKASTRSVSGQNTQASPRATPKKPTVPNIPANQIYIASASVDGHVCVSSLVDPADVTLRNFARPVQAVALSPEYKYDRTYLSGGLAGNLILTVGGKTGVSADANTNSAAAAAQGWLGSIGLGSNTGKDTILHSGEGGIASVKFSKSGRFVAWINEFGIKVMRSHMKLDSAELQHAWKRIGHVDRPGHDAWEDMAAVWKGRLEWITDGKLESDDLPSMAAHGRPLHSTAKKRYDRLVAGWGDTAWILHVHSGGTGVGRHAGEKVIGSVELIHKFTFDDCIISGITLYTPSLLAILAYRTRDDDDKPIATKPGASLRSRRQNALSPELRLVEVTTGEEVDVDTLTVSRYESLSVTDYHLSSLWLAQPPVTDPVTRGTLETIGAGMWDMTNSATRIFSSGASIRSAAASGENGKGSVRSPAGSLLNVKPAEVTRSVLDAAPGLTSSGLKLIIHTPYDCVLAIKRDASDHLSWLLEHQKYAEAWGLLDRQPNILKAIPERQPDSIPGTPSKKQGSLADFLADDSASQTTISQGKTLQNAVVVEEKKRIGDLWLKQLISAGEWRKAGQTTVKVLNTSERWEHWILAFAEAKRFDDIAEHIPGAEVWPPLPSHVYELVLGHYVQEDLSRFVKLLEKWDTDLFDVSSVITAVESRLKSEGIKPEGDTEEDWRALVTGLAKLEFAGGHAREALRCYVQLQDADAAMALIKDHHLADAVADDVPGLLMLRVSRQQLAGASISTLREATDEAVDLLVDEAYNGIVQPRTVVEQLKAMGSAYDPFIYLYFSRLWSGPEVDEDRIVSKVERLNNERLTTEGRVIVEEYADLALKIFAEFDHELLSLFLRTSNAYSLDLASQLCEERNYTPDLIYLLSKTGQTKKALSFIIERLHDVSQAIAFTKDNPDLWDDLLDYSMDKPAFIRTLLGEVGTAVDPVKLVRRIPEGIEIDGLKEAVQKLVREYDIQFSISEGVARVLRGEVATGLDALREGRRRGLRFEAVHSSGPNDEKLEVKVDPLLNSVAKDVPLINEDEAEVAQKREPKPGRCAVCDDVFDEDETDFLVGFACGHVYHLDCLLDRVNASKEAFALVETLREQTRSDQDVDAGDTVEPRASRGDGNGATTRSVGAKVSHAQIIRSAVRGGCPECEDADVGLA